MDRQTNKDRKQKCRESGGTKKSQINISLWNVLALKFKRFIGTINLFRMSKYSLLITCKQSGNGRIH